MSLDYPLHNLTVQEIDALAVLTEFFDLVAELGRCDPIKPELSPSPRLASRLVRFLCLIMLEPGIVDCPIPTVKMQGVVPFCHLDFL